MAIAGIAQRLVYESSKLGMSVRFRLPAQSFYNAFLAQLARARDL